MASTSFPSTTIASQPNLTNQSESGASCNSHFTSIHYTFLALILVLALLGNGFICVAFMTRRKLRTVTNYFVMNLAVADFLIIIQWFIWGMFDIACEPMGLNVPLLPTLELIFSSASVVGLAVVSYDRFYAVNHALHYGSTMTHWRAVMAIVAVWVYSTTTAFIKWGALDESIRTVYLRVYTVLLFVFNFFLPFLISAYCYVRIFLIAMLHLRHAVPANQLSDPLSKASTVRKQLKISLNIFILAVPFLFMWNAYYGITVYEVLCTRCEAVVEQYSSADIFLSNLPQIVAAINPVIFIFLTNDLRTTAMMCIRCTTGSRRRGDRLGQSENYSTATKYTTNYQEARKDSNSKL